MDRSAPVEMTNEFLLDTGEMRRLHFALRFG